VELIGFQYERCILMGQSEPAQIGLVALIAGVPRIANMKELIPQSSNEIVKKNGSMQNFFLAVSDGKG
jgi:hypothetical protein